MGYPTVNRQQVDNFLKVYNRGGLMLLFDDKSRQAMVDFANIALKSFVEDINAQSIKLREEKLAATGKVPAPTNAVANQTAVPKPSGIVLTD